MKNDFVKRFLADPVEASQWFLGLDPHVQQRLLADPAVARGVLKAAGLQHPSHAFDVGEVRRRLTALRQEVKGAGKLPEKLAAVIDTLGGALPSEVIERLTNQADWFAGVAATPLPTLPELAGRPGADLLVQGLDALEAGHDSVASGAFRRALNAGDPVVGARAAAGIATVAAKHGADAVLPALAVAASLAARGDDVVFGRAVADRWAAVRATQVGAEQARTERRARWPLSAKPD